MKTKNTQNQNTRQGGGRSIKKWLRTAGVIAILAVLAAVLLPNLAPKTLHEGDLSPDEIPAYSGEAYVEINGGRADFSDEEMTTEAYESYSELDDLGRCGTAEACLGEELMPTGERDRISEIHPSGWHSDKYDFIEGGNLYNRSHLIAYSLAGENANENNLITGTRHMNADVMEPFESMTKWYICDTGNHVMYRVTPIFEGENLIASGVHMMAKSVEDGGVGIDFNVYIYNVQPGVEIDYRTGDNKLSSDSSASEAQSQSGAYEFDSKAVSQQPADSEADYVINLRTGKFHYPDCSGVADISEGNRRNYSGTREELINLGYEPCGGCRP